MELALLLVVLTVVALVFGWVQQRRDRRALAANVDEARVELRDQLAVVADRLIALADLPTSDNLEARRHLGEASATYSEALDTVERAATLGQVERAADGLDKARWQLEAAAALIDGQAVPGDEPGSGACFFDPTHGAGTVVEELRTSAGTVHIKVCGYCSAKLDRGEQPTPRAIPVGGRTVPAPSAPRHHGGGGVPDALDRFDIRTPDGRTVSFNWR